MHESFHELNRFPKFPVLCLIRIAFQLNIYKNPANDSIPIRVSIDSNYIMKLYAVLVLVAAAVLATSVAQSHHSSWGQLRWNSSAIFVYHVKNDSKFLQSIQRRIQYPPTVNLQKHITNKMY